MKLKTAKRLLLILLLLMFVSFIIMSGTGKITFLYIGVIFAAASIILGLIFLRCPECRALLDRPNIFGNAEHCPYCGKRIDPDKKPWRSAE